MSTSSLIRRLLPAALRGTCFPAMRLAVPLACAVMRTSFDRRTQRLRCEVAYG
jgi:hypothetical protein